MKRLLTIAAICFAAPAMAQTIPPVPNVSSFGTSKTLLESRGAQLEGAVATVGGGSQGTLGNGVINLIENTDSTVPGRGLINNPPTGQFNLGTIHGSIPQPH